MNLKYALLLSVALLVVVAWGVWCCLPGPATTIMQIGETRLTVRVADTLEEQNQGLSNIPLRRLRADGMVFLFSGAEVHEFWMHEMRFPLDMVWIVDGRVVAIEAAVPVPVPNQPIPIISSAPFMVDTVLEVPAGKAQEYGIVPGATVVIDPQ